MDNATAHLEMQRGAINFKQTSESLFERIFLRIVKVSHTQIWRSQDDRRLKPYF
jgi:hypothetical protein